MAITCITNMICKTTPMGQASAKIQQKGSRITFMDVFVLTEAVVRRCSSK